MKVNFIHNKENAYQNTNEIHSPFCTSDGKNIKCLTVSTTSGESRNKGNLHTLLLRENGCDLFGGKANNVNEEKNDQEVPLLGISSVVMLANDSPRPLSWERVGISSSVLWCFLPCWRDLCQHGTISSVQFSCSVLFDSLWPHGL